MLLLLVGCASRPPVAAVLDRGSANLVLAQQPEELLIAQEMAGRSNWPALTDGYRFELSNTATRVIVDDQSFFDPLGGIHINVGESVRSTTTVR